MRASRFSKIAGISLAGFVVAAVAADKVNLSPLASQVAGFVGAFVGSLAASRRRRLQDSADNRPNGRTDRPAPDRE